MKKAEQTYSTFDICKALKIPKERFREWLIRGFIKPSIQEARGQGTRAVFSKMDVYRVELFKRFLEMGFKREYASFFIKEQSKTLWQLQTMRFFVIGFNKYGDEAIMAGRETREHALQSVAMMLDPGLVDTILVMNIEHLKGEIDAALASLQK